MYSREDAARIAAAWLRSSDHTHPEPPTPSTLPFTIALSREAGSGGTMVARELGRRLSWPVYDNELLAELAKILEVDITELESVDERPGSRLVEIVEAFASSSSVTEVKYFRSLMKLVLALGVRGQCIIVGRGAMIALPPETTLRVRVVATLEDRIAAVGRELNLPQNEAARHVESTDRERTRFIKNHFRVDPADPLLYDVILNGSRFSVEACAGVVHDALQQMQARKPGAIIQNA